MRVICWAAMYQLMSSSQLLSGSSVDDGVGGVQPQLLLPKPNMNVEEMSSALERCIKVRDGADASMMHAHIRNHGLEGHHLLGNQLVSMLVNVGNMKDAHTVFDKLTHKKERSWNSLMSGYVGCGEPGLALSLYEKMKAEDDSLYPSPHSCAALLKACAQLKDVQRGSRIHADVEKKGLLRRFVVVGNAVINMYTKCHLLEKALEVFEKLPVQNVVSWNTLITGYVKDGFDEEALTCFYLMQRKGVSPNSVTFICSLKACGNMGEMEKAQHIHGEIARIGLLETDVFVGTALVDMYIKAGFLAKAQEVFDKLPAPNVVSWNALITGYGEHGSARQALACFKQMKLQKISPDLMTYASILKSCGSSGAIGNGQEIHAEIIKRGLERCSISVGNSLITMYANCGLIVEATEVFNDLELRDVISWTAMMKGYAMNHEGRMAIECFEEMQEQGIVRADDITLTCLLTACSHAWMVMEGIEYLKIMREKYGIIVKEQHYSCMIDLLGRSGYLYEAERALEALCPSSGATWAALLSACKTFVKAELGSKCFDELLQKDPDCATSYSIMANICASGDTLHMVKAPEPKLQSNKLNDVYDFQSNITEGAIPQLLLEEICISHQCK